MPEISVNLATYNRAAFLEKCLVSLCRQNIDPARYEICVVNNACTDETPAIVAKIAALYPQHRVFMVSEPKPGLSRARNCGLRATQAPLVAHVDDDGTVDSDWLERFIAHFAALGSDTVVVGGEIEPVWEIPKPDWLNEKMQWFLSAGSGLGTEARFLNEDEYTSEGNSCYRRQALEQAGGFPENLGRAGSCLLSGEQVIEAKIRCNGGRVFYDPQIKLHHFIHANRLNPLWFRQRFFWQGVSKFAIRDYQLRHGLPAPNEAFLNLPLQRENWEFVRQDTSDCLEQSMFYFHSLGFVLALTGIITIEHEGTQIEPPPQTKARRQAFQKGVADYMTDPGAENSFDDLVSDLPLDRGDWSFINQPQIISDTQNLVRLRSLGFICARAGFVKT